jgi:hypothetical protein
MAVKWIRVPGGEAYRQPAIQIVSDDLTRPVWMFPWQRIDEAPEIAIDGDGTSRLIEDTLID